ERLHCEFRVLSEFCNFWKRRNRRLTNNREFAGTVRDVSDSDILVKVVFAFFEFQNVCDNFLWEYNEVRVSGEGTARNVTAFTEITECPDLCGCYVLRSCVFAYRAGRGRRALLWLLRRLLFWFVCLCSFLSFFCVVEVRARFCDFLIQFLDCF